MRRFMVFIDWIQTTAKLFFLFFSLFLLVARKKKSLISFGVLLLAHSFFRLTCRTFTYDWLHSYLQRCSEVQPHHLVNSYRWYFWSADVVTFFFPLAASIYLPFIIGKTTNTLEFLHKIQSRFTQRGRCTFSRTIDAFTLNWQWGSPHSVLAFIQRALIHKITIYYDLNEWQWFSIHSIFPPKLPFAH